MSKHLLLTSFQPWLSHQTSNASDDLLAKLNPITWPHGCLTLLRRLPVETESASQAVIMAIDTLQPDGVICCGMAETRSHLTVESNARQGTLTRKTSVDLQSLIHDLPCTAISHDAGQFVCEGLYFNVLAHLTTVRWPCEAIFVHVPWFTSANERQLMADFETLLARFPAQSPDDPF
ncbi:peptidase C15 [Spirulina major CS-329]|uniref:pyroglutamyl-peptidase I family protein n=1 Tax=Spirulina TaxID=1154 RepID=UPI00232AD985|nr:MULTISPECIES: peptidase C15 [Spirulina]MDB9496771.1 peptidase C15 [Spirulina subsalsa CS-330]MDB9502933.1 peptidase C15 [Spirulina major CS-329]